MEQIEFNNYVHQYIKLLSLYLNKKEDKDFIIDKPALSFFYKLSKYHSLRAVLYLALKTTKVSVDQEALNKLEQYHLNNVKKAVLFDKEREELFNYLNNNQINFLPLKGIIIKEYYLDPQSREFADNDILFDDAKSDLVKAFFVNKGYEVELYKRSNHDVYLKKPFYNFEMHRALFALAEDNEIFVNYYENYLDKALVKDGYEHYLKDEDFYIYFTAHTYKHFRNSGCGIRTLIDYYVYLKNKKFNMIGIKCN